MHKTTWIALTLLAGAFLPIQAGLNAKLGKAAGSALHASLISFMVGTIALLVYLVITKPGLSIDGLRSSPAYIWTGGLLGAFYVTVVVFAFPKLGPGLTFGLLITGQMALAMILEHFNILVSQQQPINFMRLLGVGLLIAGVVILRKF